MTIISTLIKGGARNPSCYDNLVMTEINVSALVLNPVELTEYAGNKVSLLMNEIREELPDFYVNTFIIYNNRKKE